MNNASKTTTELQDEIIFLKNENDVLEQKLGDGQKQVLHLAEALKTSDELMKNFAEGIYLIRLRDGIIVYTNLVFEKMFGYEPGEMLGKNVSMVNTPTDKDPEETVKEIMAILHKTGEWHGEVNNIKKDGTTFWGYANVSIFEHPEYGSVLISVHSDLTDRKRANKELAFQNAEKEKRSEELVIAKKEKEKRADELIVANKELVFQNREKEKRADELIIANKELAFQNEEKEKRADELIIANKELVFQNEEKEKRAAELIIAKLEKEKRAAELVFINKELVLAKDKEKLVVELTLVNKELTIQITERKHSEEKLLNTLVNLERSNSSISKSV